MALMAVVDLRTLRQVLFEGGTEHTFQDSALSELGLALDRELREY